MHQEVKFICSCCHLSDDSITLITYQCYDVLNRQNGFLLSTYLNIKTREINWMSERVVVKEMEKRLKEGGSDWKAENFNLLTSTRQSCWTKRSIQRVPGMDLVLTTLYFPFGFHTSICTGAAMVVFPSSLDNVRLDSALPIILGIKVCFVTSGFLLVRVYKLSRWRRLCVLRTMEIKIV